MSVLPYQQFWNLVLPAKCYPRSWELLKIECVPVVLIVLGMPNLYNSSLISKCI